MKNEALERLWRMLNLADIEGKGATSQQVSEWFSDLLDGANYVEDMEQELTITSRKLEDYKNKYPTPRYY